jgi:hypothetical protein
VAVNLGVFLTSVVKGEEVNFDRDMLPILEVMETLWADISKKPSELPSPAWHRDVLQERRQLVEEGKLKFLDWDTAITELREEIRGNTSS